MRAPRVGLLAGVMVGLTALAETGSVILAANRQPGYEVALFGLYEMTIVVIGGLIAVRHPRSPVGWILLGFGVFEAIFSDLMESYGVWAAPRAWQGPALAQAIGLGTWVFGALMWILALLFIPTGTLPGPRWRLVAWAGILGVAVYLPGFLLDPAIGHDFVSGRNPLAVTGFPHGLLVAIGGAIMSLAMIAAFASLVARYRWASAVERLQLKWVALAAAILLILLPICVAFWDMSPIVRVLTPVLLTLAVLCLGAAVLRYRLFDVDLIVNRTVVYVTLTVLLAFAYGATAVGLGAVIGGFSAWTASAATLVAAVVFRPLRRAVQGMVDRKFDRDKYSAGVRIDAFLEGLRAGTQHPDRVENLLREVLRDPALNILLMLPASGRYSDVRGNPVTAQTGRAAVRLDRDGEPDVLLEYTATDDPGREAEVRDAAERARLAIEIARLQVDLNGQLIELDRSRARIATAADEERRRIQRDLHDGAQQRLVTVGISLRATESRLRASGRTDDADRLDIAVADLATTIEELRDLTNQLPLAQLDAGIGAAFRELAERAPLPVLVDVPVERLDPGVETAAYFVGCEGLTNVIKHARASAATLRATRRNGSLVVSVGDNGIGGAVARPGSGLTGLADRVQAAGGRLLVHSDRAGTVITAELPCA